MTGGEGVIVCQGGRFAGWSLYMKGGKVSFVHNWVGKQRYTITTPQAVAPGKATIRYEFAHDGGAPGSGGTGTIFVNGQKAAEGRLAKMTPFVFSADETADVGVDDATPVTEDYKERHNKIARITVEVKPEKVTGAELEPLGKAKAAEDAAVQ